MDFSSGDLLAVAATESELSNDQSAAFSCDGPASGYAHGMRRSPALAAVLVACAPLACALLACAREYGADAPHDSGLPDRDAGGEAAADDAGGGIDAGVACDGTKPFELRPLDGPMGWEKDVRWPRLTADELTLVFTSDLNSGDLFLATREGVAQPFRPATVLTTVNSNASEAGGM